MSKNSMTKILSVHPHVNLDTGGYVEITQKHVSHVEKMNGRVKVDGYEIYSGKTLIMTLYVRPE